LGARSRALIVGRWSFWREARGIEIIIERKIGRLRIGKNNVNIGRIIKATTVNYQSRSIRRDVAIAGLRDPAKTRLGELRRSLRPREGASELRRQAFPDVAVVEPKEGDNEKKVEKDDEDWRLRTR
jgi:hypothetical protein